MNRLARSLALLLYAVVSLGGAGLHLLEFAARDDCRACHTTSSGPAWVAPCEDGPLPCDNDSHSHHNHAVHLHEDGCTTCGAFGAQLADAPAIQTGLHVGCTGTPLRAAPVACLQALVLPPDRAPPAA